MTALLFELFAHLGGDIRIDNHGLLRRAYRSVIEACPRENIRDGFRDIGCPLDIDRYVAGADTEGGFSGGICRAYEARATRCQYHRSLLVLHEGFGSLNCRVGQTLD